MRKLVFHGDSHTTEYNIWKSMHGRCYDTANASYENYGGRGITVCERWLNNYLNFKEDMGLRPSINHTLDRIDGEKNYEPDNCRWATKEEQKRNRRTVKVIYINNKWLSVFEYAKSIGWSYRRTNRHYKEMIKTVNDLTASEYKEYVENGPLNETFEIIPGQIYRNFTAIKLVKMVRDQPIWLFKCCCGKEFECGIWLINSQKKSCGCTDKKIKRQSETIEYYTWSAMKKRCNLPACTDYPMYGGRGIKVCDRWNKFENFLEDMGRKPSKDHILERKEINGNYEPNNCIWILNEKRSRIKTSTVIIEIDGKWEPLFKVAERMEISTDAVLYRFRNGLKKKYVRDLLPTDIFINT